MLYRLTLVVLLLSTAFQILAEGTREVAPNGNISIDGNATNDIAALHIGNPDYDNFALWGASDPNSRFYINIQDPASECIYIGFSYAHLNGNSSTPPPRDFRFRILDPAGNVVYGPIDVPAGSENIETWEQAFNGPNVFAGGAGYDPFVVSSADLGAAGWGSPGDYYIEFENTTDNQPILIDYWDATVANCAGAMPVEKKGRVWSYNWSFFAVNDFGFPNRPFNGGFYVCAPDTENPDASFVTKIDFNNSGFMPAAFNVAFNSFGAQNTGDVVVDRRSVQNANSTIPEYAIYLNDPVDICITAEVGSLAFTALERCGENDYCIEVISNKSGQVEILIDLDGQDLEYSPGTSDRLLVLDIDSAEVNEPVCLDWDGLDGNGVHIDDLGQSEVPLVLFFAQGIYHFPIYDAEVLENGFQLQAIRPAGPTPLLFYDDSNIDAPAGTGEPDVQLNGCTVPCHTWDNYTGPNVVGFGNLNTINSWWFSQRQVIQVQLPAPSYLSCAISGDSSICEGESAVLRAELVSTPDPDFEFDSVSYSWSGAGITGPADGPEISLDQPGEYELQLTYGSGNVRFCSSSCTFVVSEDEECCEFELACPDPFAGAFFGCEADIPPPLADIDELIAEGLQIEGDLCYPLLMEVEEPQHGQGGCTDTLVLTRTYLVYADENEDGLAEESELRLECSRSFTVLDTVAPSLSFEGLPPGLEAGDTLWLECNGQTLPELLPDFSEVTVHVEDNCGDTTVATFTDSLLAEGDCPEDGYIALFRCGWLAEDLCLNEASFIFYVGLRDTEAPEFLDIPVDMTLSCESDIPPADSIGVTDACLCAHLEVEEEIGDQLCPGSYTLTRTYTATDHCGNSASYEQRISVVDEQAPELIPLAPELIEITSGSRLNLDCEGFDLPQWIRDLDEDDMTAVDNCAEATVTFQLQKLDEGSCETDGYIELYEARWLANDGCGNTSTFFFEVALTDLSPPEILSLPEGDCSSPPDGNDILATDNCGSVIVEWTVDTSFSACSENLQYNYHWMVRDACGNTATASKSYLAGDQLPPQIRYIDPLRGELFSGDTVEVSCDRWSKIAWEVEMKQNAEVSDNCEEGLRLFIESGLLQTECGENGFSTLRRYRLLAGDQCGNLDSFILYVGLIDLEPPYWEGFQPSVELLCGDPIPPIDVYDRCGDFEMEVEEESSALECPNLERITRRVSATDACGNRSDWEQTILISSPGGPLWIGDDTFACAIDEPIPFAYDPCTGEALDIENVSEKLILECGQAEIVERVWQAIDHCGNIGTFSQIIYDNDFTAPEIYIEYERGTPEPVGGRDTSWIVLECGESFNYRNRISASDECALQSLSFNINSNAYSCENSDYYRVDVYGIDAVDGCSNTSRHQLYVGWIDRDPPVFQSVPEEITVACESVDTPTVEVEDECTSIDYIEYQRTELEGGSYLNRWIAADLCGNTDSLEQLVTVEGSLDCMLDMPENVACFSDSAWIEVSVSGGAPPYRYDWTVLSGDCVLLEGEGSERVRLSMGYFPAVIEVVATDQNGCQITCRDTLECMLKKDEMELKATSRESGLFEIYPNPATNFLNVVVAPTVQDRQVQIIDLWGRTVYRSTLYGGNDALEIPVGELSGGMYVIAIGSSSGERLSRRWIRSDRR